MIGSPQRNAYQKVQLTRCALIFALVYPPLFTAVYFIGLAHHTTLVQQLSYTVGKTLQFLLPMAWLLLLQREPRHWRPIRTAGLREGLCAGLLILGLMLLLYQGYIGPAGIAHAAHDSIRQKLLGFGITRTSQYIVLGIFYSIIHAFLEEYYWRWFVFGRLRQLLSVRHAMIVSSLGFTAHHMIVLALYFGITSIITWLFALAVAVGGAYWSWLYQRSNSLCGPWLSHALIDGGIFVIGYWIIGGLG